MTGRTKFYMVTGLGRGGERVLYEPPRPEHQIGDAKYFPDGLPDRWVLRPMTPDDMVDGVSFQPGTWILVRQFPNIGRIYSFVKLPHKLRRNSASNALEAYRRFCENRPEFDGFIRKMEELSIEFAAKIAAEAA